MTIDPDTGNLAPGRGKPWLIGLLAFIVFGLLGTGIAFYGIHDSAYFGGESAKDVSATTPANIVRIDMPYADAPIPPGTHDEEFRAACTVCHSTRLVFTQPRLSEKQWQGVVHKMVAVYGAPLSGDDEKRIVSYLQTVHGK